MGPLHPTLIAAASRHVAKLAQGATMSSATTVSAPSAPKIPSSSMSSPGRIAAPKPPSVASAVAGPARVAASGVNPPATSANASQSGGVIVNKAAFPLGSGNILQSQPSRLPVPTSVSF